MYETRLQMMELICVKTSLDHLSDLVDYSIPMTAMNT
jgi:hypothetical protein